MFTRGYTDLWDHHPSKVFFHPVQVMHARLYTKASWREASNLMISTVPSLQFGGYFLLIRKPCFTCFFLWRW